MRGSQAGRAVAVLSHGLWTRRFGRDPGIVGRTIMLDGQPREVVGVMPPAFAFPDRARRRLGARAAERDDGVRLFELLGRGAAARRRRRSRPPAPRFNGLLPGSPTPIRTIRARAATSTRRSRSSDARSRTRVLGNITRATVAPAGCRRRGPAGRLRQRRQPVPRAIGGAATRGRDSSSARRRAPRSRALFPDRELPAGDRRRRARRDGRLGRAAGAGPFGPATLPRLHEIQLDADHDRLRRVLLSLLAAVVFGSIPLWRGLSTAALHESGRANTATRQRHPSASCCIGAQVAMALVLLVASGLMVRSVHEPARDRSGLQSRLDADVQRRACPNRKYPTHRQRDRRARRIIERLAALPGVTRHAGTTCLPFSVRLQRQHAAGRRRHLSAWHAAAAGDVPGGHRRLLRGDGHAAAARPHDRSRRRRSQGAGRRHQQTLAKRAFEDQDPIGRRVASNQPPARRERAADAGLAGRSSASSPTCRCRR